MTAYTAPQVKKALSEAGFEVYRTRGDEVFLADRVRENLIMDSGVRLRVTDPLQVRLVVRVTKTDFPTEGDSAMFERARALAEPAVGAGFQEVGVMVTTAADPSDPSRTLETFYDVTFGRDVDGLPAAFEGLRFALALEKALAVSRDA